MLRQLSVFISALCLLAGSLARADVPAMAQVVRQEALRSQQDSTGRPLPLVASWDFDYLTLTTQAQMIKDGVPLLPWIWYGRTYTADSWNSWSGAPPLSDSDKAAIQSFKEWQIPIAMVSVQWEGDFYSSSDYSKLAIDQTGLGMNLDGSKMQAVSPFSPVDPWKALGEKWTNNAAIKFIESLYPEPPLVLFVSNNEATRLSPGDANSEKRFVDTYGKKDLTSGSSDYDFTMDAFGDNWITRYSAMFAGARSGLAAATAWQKNSRFVGYNAFGPDHWGRWWYWRDYSLATQDRADPSWYSWDGAVPEAYDNNWEPEKTTYNLWSMQSEMMNLVFMKDEALKVKPDFWFELIFWDGYQSDSSNSKYTTYKNAGIDYTPELYGGWVQYDLWLLVPRVAREFRYLEQPSRFMPYFQQIIDAVKRVHSDTVLTRFWRQGTLVANRSRAHPFSYSLLSKWSGVDRWFDLTTNLDPSSNDLSVKWPVWTLARLIGTTPNREWLVYAHASMDEKTNVQVTIPDYKTIQLPRVPVAGAFYYVTEKTGAVVQVGTTDGVPAAPTLNLKSVSG